MNGQTSASSVLVGNDAAKAQDFVLKQQVVAADEGFKNVSKLWYDKTIDFDTAIEQIEASRQNCSDLMVKVSNITPVIIGENGFGIEIGDGRKISFNDHGLRQFCAKMGSPFTPIDFLMRNPESQNGKVKFTRDIDDMDVLVYWFENIIRRLDSDAEYLFRIYDNGHDDKLNADVGTCRAVLTDRYSMVSNVWYLEILKEIIPGGRCSHWTHSDGDSIVGNIIIPDSIREEEDSDYGGMVSVRGCEIGRYAISQMPSIFRAICMNGNIWGQTKGVQFKKRHLSINLDDLAEQIRDNIQAQIPLTTKGVDLLLATRKFEAKAAAAKLIAQLHYDKMVKATTSEIEAISKEWSLHVKDSDNKANCFGFIDAITRASQNFDVHRNETFDTFAGMMLSQPKFESFDARAKTLSKEDVLTAFKIKQNA